MGAWRMDPRPVGLWWDKIVTSALTNYMWNIRGAVALSMNGDEAYFMNNCTVSMKLVDFCIYPHYHFLLPIFTFHHYY